MTSINPLNSYAANQWPSELENFLESIDLDIEEIENTLNPLNQEFTDKKFSKYVYLVKDAYLPSPTKTFDNLTSYCAKEKITPRQLLERKANGIIDFIDVLEEEGKKPITLAPPQHKEHFDGCDLILNNMNKKGKIDVKVLARDDYELKAYTPEQYARISQAASRALEHLTHSLKKEDKEGKSPLKERSFNHLKDSHFEMVKNKFPKPQELRVESEKKEAVALEILETEIAIQNERAEERKTKRKDEKFLEKKQVERQQDERKDILKQERLKQEKVL